MLESCLKDSRRTRETLWMPKEGSDGQAPADSHDSQISEKLKPCPCSTFNASPFFDQRKPPRLWPGNSSVAANLAVLMTVAFVTSNVFVPWHGAVLHSDDASAVSEWCESPGQCGCTPAPEAERPGGSFHWERRTAGTNYVIGRGTYGGVRRRAYAETPAPAGVPQAKPCFLIPAQSAGRVADARYCTISTNHCAFAVIPNQNSAAPSLRKRDYPRCQTKSITKSRSYLSNTPCRARLGVSDGSKPSHDARSRLGGIYPDSVNQTFS